ncbi:MAG: hypothetical protein A3H98_13605 [Bacteroidetes bacterium RIFCSPLOWO2_02_FULL_36_8]|nr:MAG: hypothetical protein A3H98_13605 [Bacteroidetes bacterium RIFCSPLOWO2_02_FULL_36_8]OFY70857.1 MAG: hypothetical protein A3G23_12100 [Bacteroidetes bacterium RIFCSPLOWO2_12_FULL_37_12]
MRNCFQINPLKIAVIFITAFSTNAFPQNGEVLFKTKCASCHTLGDGELIGPDLSGVTQRHPEPWLMEFIRSSSTMIKKGDAAAVAIFEKYSKKEMPDPKIADNEITEVITYMKKFSGAGDVVNVSNSTSQSGTSAITENMKPVTSEPTITMNSQTINTGLMYFTGEKRFTLKGPSCVTCHHVRHDSVILGGALAKNLDRITERYNEKALLNLIANPPFPAMSVAYQDKKITEEEAVSLVAFLKKSTENYAFQRPADKQFRFLYTGLAGMLLFFLLIPLVWSNKKKS